MRSDVLPWRGGVVYRVLGIQQSTFGASGNRRTDGVLYSHLSIPNPLHSACEEWSRGGGEIILSSTVFMYHQQLIQQIGTSALDVALQTCNIRFHVCTKLSDRCQKISWNLEKLYWLGRLILQLPYMPWMVPSSASFIQSTGKTWWDMGWDRVEAMRRTNCGRQVKREILAGRGDGHYRIPWKKVRIPNKPQNKWKRYPT